MSRLILSFLGPLQITLDDEPITTFRSDKERALLAFLALEADRPHRRDALIGLLWPEQPEAQAFNNLRKSLHRLRQALGDPSPQAGSDEPGEASKPGSDKASPFLIITLKTVQFNPDSDYHLDVAEFTCLLKRCQQHPHRHLETCATCQGRLELASRLYREDFLQGFFLVDSMAFEEWLLVKREGLRRQALEALAALTEFYLRREEYSLAQHYGRRQLAFEPWRESAHRQLIQALAWQGERSAALTQYEVCRRVLAQEFNIEPETETRALYERLRKEQSFQEAPAVLSSLATQITPFIGREAEIEQLTAWLLQPAYRLITVVGEGGVGKTRLAVAVAEEVRGDFLQGAWLVPLAGLAGGEASGGNGEVTHLHNTLATAIATALDFSFFGQEDPKRQLLNYLREKELLLVLDNFEHLLAGAELILEILKAAPRIVLLVTTREPLNFQAERLLRLEGLPAPASHDPEAAAYSSVQLFVERAQRVTPHFVLDTDTLPAVVQICQFLAGLPLGIELAAAWIKRRTPGEIAQALQTMDFLATTQGDVAVRHRSMRAVFEGSWQLLSPRHQLMLAQASVFSGSFSEVAARVVLEAEPEDLWALVDKSLLRQSGPSRYELHELLRQFAAEKLESPLKAQIADRHSVFYLEYLAQREAAFRGPQPRVSMAEIQGEIENVRQAWRWAVMEMRLEGLARSVKGLTAFYEWSNLYQEGVLVFETTIEHLSPTLAVEGVELSIQAVTMTILAWLWVSLSRCLFNRARYDEAGAAAQQAVQLASQVGQIESEAMGYWRWGYAFWRRGDFAAAQTRLEHSLGLAREAGLRNLEGDCLRGLGNIAWSQGDFTQAQVCYEQALRLYRQTDDCWSQGRTLTNMGMVAASQASHSQAQVYYEQALALCHEAGDILLEFHVRNELGTIALEQGDFTEARSHFEQALRSYREGGDQYNEGLALANLGDVFLQQGDYPAAHLYYEQALGLFREIGARLGESLRLAYLGLLYHYQGNDQVAFQFSQQALQLAQALGARREQGYALTNLGHSLLGLGRLAEASEAYRQALAVQQEMGVPSRMMEPLAGLARVALAEGDIVSALAQVEEILVYLESGSLAGADAPFLVYLTCYRVLQRQQDPRAPGFLRLTYELLQRRATDIEDERLRCSFLENVPAHRELVWEFNQLLGG